MTTVDTVRCSDPAAIPENVRLFAEARLGNARSRSALIPTLHLLQNTVGYLRDDHMGEVGAMFALSLNEVRGVASFYHFFTFEPKGDHPIAVCTGTACHVRGSAKVLARIRGELGIDEGERTEDGRFSLGCARCIGMCAMAPVLTVGEKVYGGVDEGEVLGLLEAHGFEAKKDVKPKRPSRTGAPSGKAR